MHRILNKSKCTWQEVKGTVFITGECSFEFSWCSKFHFRAAQGEFLRSDLWMKRLYSILLSRKQLEIRSRLFLYCIKHMFSYFVNMNKSKTGKIRFHLAALTCKSKRLKKVQNSQIYFQASNRDELLHARKSVEKNQCTLNHCSKQEGKQIGQHVSRNQQIFYGDWSVKNYNVSMASHESLGLICVISTMST